MSRAFVKPIDPATATAENLWTLMVANGCTSTPIGVFLQLNAPAGEDLYWGSDATVDATGNAIPLGESQFLPAENGTIDPSLYWVFVTGGTAFNVNYLCR